MKHFLLRIAVLALASTLATAQTAVLTSKDLELLEGAKWTATLTYIDYRSNKKTSIKSNLTITRKKDKNATWIFAYEYPDEPKANDISDATLSLDGKTFFGETVVEKSRLPDKSVRIVTTQSGSDNDRKALFRYTYVSSPRSLSIKKEVQIEGTREWLARNEYSWTR